MSFGLSRSWLVTPLCGLASLCLLAGPGCDTADGPATPAPATRVVTTGPAGTGVIRGTVTFRGTAPDAEEVDGSRCHAGCGTIRVAPVEVGPGGALRDVMVYVKDPGVAPALAPGAAPVVLDQVNCQYSPRVLGVRVGQVLKVTSSDPTLHNVHTLSKRNPGLNVGMTRPGDAREVTFDRPEQFAVRCDVHPWMTATVLVLDHPYFAVTGEGGAFEVAGLPLGEHEVVFSHPFLGERTRKVTVGPGVATADVTFEKGQ
jgi:plastocyanin